MKRLFIALILLSISISTTGCGSSGGDEPSVTTTTDCSSYDRNDFRSWIDADGDCQNTRAEVLITESLGSVGFTSSSQCTVSSGLWYDPYTNQNFTNASDLDIDHFVPLKEAYDSGALSWDSNTKVQYGNYLDDPNHLIAVSASANRSKSDRDPAGWMPQNQSYHIDYAKAWVSIKVKWGLTADSAELSVLKNILNGQSGITYPQEAPESICTSGSSGGDNPSPSCCRVCTPGKSYACGNACISVNYNCHTPPGCACNG